MATHASDIAIIIVQGSVQTPLVYAGLLSGLVARGFITLHPELPSCSDPDHQDFPSTTLHDDTEVVRKEVARLVEDEGRRVVLVMHSYGGIVGSNAVSEDLSLPHRKSKNLRGGVMLHFYIAPYALEIGQSAIGVFGEFPNADIEPDGRLYLQNGAALLYNDLPDAEAALWESRMIPAPFRIQKGEMVRLAYQFVQSIYLICENDAILPPQLQEMFAEKMGARIERCSSGHSPMLSQLDMLIGKIVQAIEDAVGKEAK
ncbi:catalytic protein [Polyplosphaeria fusca]|uniref:Catalytic protein n=1 Tax=Polyplosphaeria fusca TaxID=682080 RepID=A0A9P4QRB3_9PLEO|nr:catalytic protein [Polyplosphaeria fusca]